MKAEALLKTSALIFLFLVAAKAFNFFKKILIGQLFGVSWVADAFFAASYLPYYLAIFFEGILFLGFLPLFSQVMNEKGREEANQFVSEILLLVVVLTGAFAALAWWQAPWVVGELVPGFSSERQGLTCSLFRVLSLVLVFISLTSFFKALNSYFENYTLAASSGLVDTVVMIALTLVGWKVGGIHAAAWASVAGAAVALAAQAVPLFRKHLVLPRRFRIQTLWLGRLFLFLIPMSAIWAFQQIPLVILTRFGSGMWEGTISALTIAQTLTTVPMGLVSHTVLFAIFPSLAREANGLNGGQAKETFFQTLRGGFLILVPTGFLLSALARPVAVLFFQGGGISPEGTTRIANSLACFGWATFALYADLFMSQSLIAVRRPLPAVCLSASRAALTYGIGYFLSTHWDYQGLALSFSLALAVNLAFLFPFFFRMSPFRGEWKNLFLYAARLILAASPALLLGTFLSRWPMEQWFSFSRGSLVVVLTLGLAAGCSLYGAILFLLGVKEVRSIVQEVAKAWGRRNWYWVEETER